MQKLCKDVLRKLCFERLLRYFKCFKGYLKLVIPLEKKAACDVQCQTMEETVEAFNRHFHQYL